MRLGVLKELRPRLVATFTEKPGSCEGTYARLSCTFVFIILTVMSPSNSICRLRWRFVPSVTYSSLLLYPCPYHPLPSPILVLSCLILFYLVFNAPVLPSLTLSNLVPSCLLLSSHVMSSPLLPNLTYYTLSPLLQGHPFLVEAAVSIGGTQVREGINVYRFANRIPLLFETGIPPFIPLGRISLIVVLELNM